MAWDELSVFEREIIEVLERHWALMWGVRLGGHAMELLAKQFSSWTPSEIRPVLIKLRRDWLPVPGGSKHPVPRDILNALQHIYPKRTEPVDDGPPDTSCGLCEGRGIFHLLQERAGVRLGFRYRYIGIVPCPCTAGGWWLTRQPLSVQTQFTLEERKRLADETWRQRDEAWKDRGPAWREHEAWDKDDEALARKQAHWIWMQARRGRVDQEQPAMQRS